MQPAVPAMSARAGHQRIAALVAVVFGMARRHCPASHYEDYAQDAMLHLLSIQRARRLLREAGDAYLKRAARNHIFDSLRAYQREAAYCAEPIVIDPDGDAFNLAELIPDPSADPEQIVIANQRLNDLAARLSCRQNIIVKLLMAGRRQNEIAASLGVSPGYVSQQVAKIRQAAIATDRDDEKLAFKFS